MTYRTTRATIVATSMWVAVASSAHAQSEDGAVEATVVRIDGDDVYLDVGGEEARRGLELDVHRAIEVRHPVTRRVLRDRFVIARVRIVDPGDTLSIARVVGTPHRPVEVGDTVERHGVPPARAAAERQGAAECPEVACAPCPECEEGIGDPEAREVVAVWQATLGKPPEERRRLYGIFLERNPQSRFVSAVRQEMETLRQIEHREAVLVQRAVAAHQDQRSVALAGAVDSDPLEMTTVGSEAEITASVSPDAPVAAVLAYVRQADDGSPYEVVRMELDERGHARARVPSAYVGEPGFEYFVEAVRPDGAAVPVRGTGQDPVRVAVVPPRGAARASPGNRSRVHVSSELVSFNGFEGNDWYLITEADFLYRILYHALYGVRVGYGHFTGEGGTVEELDEMGLEPRPAGFTYGYLEFESRFAELFALMARVTVGLGSEEDGLTRNDTGLRGGFQLRVRIGDERGTNLVLAGETIPEIGQRAFIGLTWEALEGFPMTAEVHVTDQPINTDELAVRGVFQVGYRVTDQLALAARLSYQGRTIDHAGLGGGLAATFDW